jgi:hypothetical protein
MHELVSSRTRERATTGPKSLLVIKSKNKSSLQKNRSKSRTYGKKTPPRVGSGNRLLPRGSVNSPPEFGGFLPRGSVASSPKFGGFSASKFGTNPSPKFGSFPPPKFGSRVSGGYGRISLPEFGISLPQSSVGGPIRPAGAGLRREGTYQLSMRGHSPFGPGFPGVRQESFQGPRVYSPGARRRAA